MRLSIILKLLNSNGLDDIILGYEYYKNKYKRYPKWIIKLILKRHSIALYNWVDFWMTTPKEILTIHRKNDVVDLNITDRIIRIFKSKI